MDEEKRKSSCSAATFRRRRSCGRFRPEKRRGIPGGEAVPEPEWHRAEFGDAGVRRATARPAQAVAARFPKCDIPRLLDTRPKQRMLDRSPICPSLWSGPMSALTVYKIFAYSLILILFALYWPLRAASARVKKEIEKLNAENDADAQAGCAIGRTEDSPP